jgi:H+/Cl- antiporter ClcA
MLCEKIMFSETNPSRSNQITNYFVNDYLSSLDEANDKMMDKVHYFQNEITQYLSFSERMKKYFDYFNLKTYLAVVTITIAGSVMFLILINVANSLVGLRYEYCYSSLFLMLVTGVIAALFATGITGNFAPTAEASGLPELKTVLSGTIYYNFLTIQTMWAKYFSSLMVKLSGLGMGFEGAFTHIIAIMAHHLVKLPFFKTLNNFHDQQIIMTAGVCAAFVVAFGTPVGGIIFTIELCSHSFQVNTLFKCFISATIAYSIYCLLHNVFKVSIIGQVSDIEYSLGELHHFILLGLLEGFLSAGYMFVFSKYLMFKRNSKHPIFSNRYIYIAIVASIVAIFTFPHHNFKFGFKQVLTDMTNLHNLTDPKRLIHWWSNGDKVVIELIYVLCTRIFMFICFSTSAIPFGVFGPGIMIGAIFGRVYGEIGTRYFGFESDARAYSIAATAAFISGVTKTFSPFVCVMEMVGQYQLMFPSLLTTVVAFGVSAVFNIGFLDMIIAIRKLPYLPTFMPPARGKQLVSEIVQPVQEDFLYTTSTIYDILDLLVLKNDVKEHDYVPVLNPETKRIVSFVQLKNCISFLNFFSVEIDKILLTKKQNMSVRLYNLLLKFIEDHGEAAPIVISRKIRKYLRKIRVKSNKFEMEEWGTVTKNKKKEEMMDFIRSSTMFNMRESHASYVKTDRISMAFERDTVGKMKVKKEEAENKRRLLTELLSNIQVNFGDARLAVETFPIIVSSDTKLFKVHYLFLMLGIGVIWVQDEQGQLIGKVSKEDFLSFKHK